MLVTADSTFLQQSRNHVFLRLDSLNLEPVTSLYTPREINGIRSSLHRIRRSLREDGAYVFGTRVMDFALGFIRNQLIGRKLGVRQIRIGARSRLRGLSSITIGEDFSAGEGLWLEAITAHNDQTFSPRIVIGSHVRVSQFVHIAATHLVKIGDHVLLGSKVNIIDHNHGQYSETHSSPHIPPTLRPLDSDRTVSVGNNVWIADGVVVTPGSSIGEGSVIGANSVVTGHIPPFSLAFGVPAKVRKRFDFDTESWSNFE